MFAPSTPEPRTPNAHSEPLLHSCCNIPIALIDPPKSEAKAETREKAWFRKLRLPATRQKEAAAGERRRVATLGAVSLSLLCEIVVVAGIIAVCSKERHAFGFQRVTVGVIAKRD